MSFIWFREVLTLFLMSLKAFNARLGTISVAVIGFAGVVVIFVSVLAIRDGFDGVLERTGSSSVAIVMREGAQSELNSSVSMEDVRLIEKALAAQDVNIDTNMSAETLVIVGVDKKTDNTEVNVPFRGVQNSSLNIHDQVKIVEGRSFIFGLNEVIVGRGASSQYTGLAVGDEVQWGKYTWKVVGIFEAGGGVYESEIWTDVKVLQSAYQRENIYQSVYVQLEAGFDLASLEELLKQEKRLKVFAQLESVYFSEQSKSLSMLITVAGFIIILVMGAGAVFGGITTMEAIVSARTIEIATLRAIGFNREAVLFAILCESILIAIAGSVIGAIAAYLIMNGVQTSTVNSESFSQVVFAFDVNMEAIGSGILSGVLMGVIGGIYPASKAAFLPIAETIKRV